ncbi:MAG: hypothetical protein JKY65_05305 [Planctomycetes bacterium]|nr:hypothetical protein [Planctomycetota bacterium]
MSGTETVPEPKNEPHLAVQFLGQFLVSQGLVSHDALDAALDFQEENNLPLGALALSKGLLSERQLLIVHAHQLNSEDRFGEVAVRRGFLTRHQLDELLREQKEARILIGDALVRAGATDADTLEVALQQYQIVQARAEEQVQNELAALPDAHLVSPAIQLTTRLLLRMCGLVAKVAAVSQDTRLAHLEYALWQEVEGTRPFTYALHIDGIDLLDLSEAVLYALDDETTLPDEVDPLVLDVGKEFVNILVGHLCTWLDREGHRCTPLPPGTGDGDLEPPVCWEGPVRRINVRLEMPRTAMAVSILVKPGDEGPPRS